MKLQYLSLAFVALLTAACSKSPREELDKVIISKSFIPYELPMPSTRVGTILRGNAKEMYLVARPEKCFPDLPDAQALRWVQATDLPSTYKRVEFAVNAQAGSVIESGNNVIKLKGNVYDIQTVQIEFSGASVEMLEESNLADYFANGMSTDCQDLVTKYPFIGQGLRINAMNFVFKNSKGATVNLEGRIYEVVDIAAGVNWRLENSYTLKIDSPKYIGYRMAKIANVNGESRILYASSADKTGKWQFKDIQALLMKEFRPQTVRAAEKLK